MKPNFLYCVLLLGALASCKQLAGQEAVIDPRDQYVGTYQGGYSGQITTGPFVSQIFSGSTVITVEKAPAAKEVTLTFVYNKGGAYENTEKLTAELTDRKFVIIDKRVEKVVVGPSTYDLPYTGTGEFTEKSQFAMTTSAEIERSGTILKKVAGITGEKK
jgi:hypothetical protein